MQRFAGDKAGPADVPPVVYDVLNTSGKPLDEPTRDFMEHRFSHNFCPIPLRSAPKGTAPHHLTIADTNCVCEREADHVAAAIVNFPQKNLSLFRATESKTKGLYFRDVRVHDGAKAVESAQAVNAKAYTVGSDIVFNTGQFTPRTKRGRELIAHELVHVLQQRGGVPSQQRFKQRPALTGKVQREPTSRPTSENIWGLRITPRMCHCRQRVRDAIAWANTAGATYAACDVPANSTGTDVEACFDAAHPGTITAGSTSSSGTMTLPPPTSDPCERIENKATFVHETMHSRHANAIARAQGTAFFSEWRRLAGDPNRLDTMRSAFPAQVAAFETQWNDGHDWAQDEVNAYRWERRFLVDALGALNRIC